MVTIKERSAPLQGAPPLLSVSRTDPRAKLPSRYDESSVGLDVFAFLITESGRPTSRAIHMKNITEVPTGIRVSPPPGFYIQISSRVSLVRRGVFVANSPGIIEPDFDSELTILLFNGSYETQYVAHEHRIAQLVLQPIIPTGVRELQPSQCEEDVCSGPR